MTDGKGASDLPVAAARQRMREAVAPVAGTDRVAVGAALGRVLAEPLIADLDVPGHDNAAMDGYAVRGADLAAAGEAHLRRVATVEAGEAPGRALGAGECARIMTGAPLPPGADTVVMQERVAVDGEAVRIPAGEAPGANVRPAGGDIAAGATVLEAGTRLGPAELGVIGSLGRVEVPVRRRLRVAFLATGDELRGAGEPLGPGQIYDSNRYTLHAALARLGVEARDLGRIPDEPEALAAALREAAGDCDALISSGGVSVGDADHVKPVLEREGQIDFWRVALRPGRPLAFGRIGGAAFFGLPGNPVSTAATYYQLVQPALRRMMGASGDGLPPLLEARAAEPLAKRPGRTEYQRGVVGPGADGRPEVRPTGTQSSGVLTSLARANCLVVLEAERGEVAPGETVAVQPLEGVL